MKKKRNEKEITEEGEVVPQKELKQQKMAKDRGRVFSVESREAEHSTDVHSAGWSWMA